MNVRKQAHRYKSGILDQTYGAGALHASVVFSQSRRSTIFKIRSVEDKAIAGTHTLPPTAISILRSDPVNFGL
jgi:hypothetical protein